MLSGGNHEQESVECDRAEATLGQEEYFEEADVCGDSSLSSMSSPKSVLSQVLSRSDNDSSPEIKPPGPMISSPKLILDEKLRLRSAEGAVSVLPRVQPTLCRFCEKLFPLTIDSETGLAVGAEDEKTFFCSGECFLTQAVFLAKRKPSGSQRHPRQNLPS